MSMALMKPELAPSWVYEPVGPYRGFMQLCDRPPGKFTGEFPDASSLIGIMCLDEVAQGQRRVPRVGWIHCVVDSRSYVVYGYSADQGFLREFQHPAWWGCRTGFEIVESLGLVEPIELAMREAVAREAIDSPDWWKNP